MSREVKAAPWDIENVRILNGENPEDVVLAIKHFVKSVGCKNEFKITCFTGSAYHADRGIPLAIYQKLRATKQVDIVSWAKTRAVTSIPRQAADGLMKDFVENLCRMTTRGVLVVIGGDQDYDTLFDTVRKNVSKYLAEEL